MGNKRQNLAGRQTTVDVVIGDTTGYEVVTTSLDSPPWLKTDDGVNYWCDTVDAVDGFRTAVNDWADQYTAWDSDGETGS